MVFPNPHLLALYGEVQGRLATHRRKDCIDVGVFLEDVDDRLRLERFEIHMVCDDRVGHDGRRVGIDEGDLDAFFLQTAGSLDYRVVKFAGLSNDNRSAANDEDRLDAVVFGHFFFIRAPHPCFGAGIRATNRRPNVVERGKITRRHNPSLHFQDSVVFHKKPTIRTLRRAHGKNHLPTDLIQP